ncbi:MAG: PorP/SprF family type IX secretion system membrane protein [Bacteroidales bacterium]
MKKYALFIIILFLCFKFGHSQQVPQFRHAIFSHFYYNPAYAMDSHKPDILLNHRSQWTGFEGSPITSSLSGTYEFFDNMAAGLTVSNDVLGASKNLNLTLSYAYQLKITDEWLMNFGIGWSFMQSQLDGSKIDLFHDDDEIVMENLSGKSWKPDANAGIMISNGVFFGSFSAMQLFEAKYRLFDDVKGSIAAQRHYFITGGGHFNSGKDSKIHADLTTQLTAGTPAYVYITGLWDYNNSVLAGLSYCHGDAIVLNAGYQYQNFVILYSYDIITSRLMSVSGGSHEITLGYHIKIDKTTSTFQPMF